jgi:hypothetical protein
MNKSDIYLIGLVFIVGLIALPITAAITTPKSIMAYVSNEMFNDPILAQVNKGLEPFQGDPVANQKIADEKEAAQMKQWNTDAQMKANGTMPLCKEGQSPISDWMASLNQTDVINGDIPINYETCVEPEKKMGAVILYPIE